MASVSSPAEASRSEEAASPPRRDAASRRNSSIAGQGIHLEWHVELPAPGRVSSTNAVMITGASAPEVMPPPSSTPAKPPSRPGKMTLSWKPTPIQNAMPATAALR